MKSRRAPQQAPHSNTVTLADDSASVARLPMRGREGILHRLGTIERAVALHGEAALLPPSPAGPATCPPRCEYCSRPWAVVA